MNKVLNLALVLLMLAVGDLSAAPKYQPVSLKTTLALPAPMAGSEGGALPADIRELALPDQDKTCGTLILVPDIKVVRLDLDEVKETSLVPEALAKEETLAEKVAKAFKGVTVETKRTEMSRRMSAVSVAGEWAKPSGKSPALAEAAAFPQIRDADLRVILTGKSDPVSEADIKAAFPDLPETYAVQDVAALNKEVAKHLCPGGAADKGSLESKSIAVLYKPKMRCPDGRNPPCNKQTECNQQLLNNGIQFMSLSKEHRGSLRQSDLKNAFQLFDRAVNEAEAANSCCAKALMNRGLVRDLLRDQALAFRDLQQAEKCGQTDKDVLYNLACFYSKHHSNANSQLGLALEALEKAVVAGFRDCSLIEKDSDLANLRKNGCFNDRLRGMLQQHGLFCQLPPNNQGCR
jgi:hypothetical protein